MRRLARVPVLVALVVLGLTGMDCPTGSDGPCPATVADNQSPTSGALRVDYGATSREGTAPDALGDCSATLSLTEVSGDAPSRPPSASLWVTCRAGDNRASFTATVGDVRDVPAGQRLSTVTAATVSFSESCQQCYCSATPGSAPSVTVEEAVGGSAPYPDVVTADFRRVLRVRLDTGGPVALEPASESHTCQALSWQVDLTFELTSADFHHLADRQCDPFGDTLEDTGGGSSDLGS